MSSTLIRNEQAKLLANAFNTAATSSFGIGVLAPIAAAFYNVTSTAVPLAGLLVGSAVWLSIAAVLHIAGRRVPRRLAG